MFSVNHRHVSLVAITKWNTTLCWEHHKQPLSNILNGITMLFGKHYYTISCCRNQRVIFHLLVSIIWRLFITFLICCSYKPNCKQNKLMICLANITIFLLFWQILQYLQYSLFFIWFDTTTQHLNVFSKLDCLFFSKMFCKRQCDRCDYCGTL